MKGKVIKVPADPKYVEAALKISPLVDAILLDPAFNKLTEDQRFLRMLHIIQTCVDFKVQSAKKHGTRMGREQQDTLLLMVGFIAKERGWIDQLEK